MQDSSYIDRFNAWDFEAFWALYDSYIDQIFAYIYRKTSDRELAEDLCTQVWIKAMESLKWFEYDECSSFKSWLYRIAGNTVIDYYRTHRNNVDIETIIEPGISHDFAAQIDAKDKLEKVKEFLNTLSDTQKEIFILRIWDDLSYREIAEILGNSQENTRKIFSRTLKMLKSHFIIFCLIVLI